MKFLSKSFLISLANLYGSALDLIRIIFSILSVVLCSQPLRGLFTFSVNFSFLQQTEIAETENALQLQTGFP